MKKASARTDNLELRVKASGLESCESGQQATSDKLVHGQMSSGKRESQRRDREGQGSGRGKQSS